MALGPLALGPLAFAPPAVVLPLVAGLGLIVGSFLSALTWRLPRGASVAHGRSACPACGATLGPRDLVPVLSWLAARGHCRHCAAAISPRYPLIEAATALLFVLIALRAPSVEAVVALAALGAVLVALAVVDLEHGLLPNVLNLAAVPPALAVAWLGIGTPVPTGTLANLVPALIGGAVAGLAAWALKAGFHAATGRDGLGWGDVKFLAVAGLVLAPWQWPVFLILAGVGGVVLGMIWRGAGRGAEFPFGPALIGALLAVLLFPETAAILEPQP